MMSKAAQIQHQHEIERLAVTLTQHARSCGFVEVNPLAHWGKSRRWKATKLAQRRGWLKLDGRPRADRWVFLPGPRSGDAEER